MNIAGMKQVFLILYDKVTNLATPGYTDAEITAFINKAQLQFLKTRYNYKGNQYGEGVEETEKRRKDLSELTRDVTITGGSTNTSNQTGVSPNGEFFDLPVGFLYTLREEILATSDDACINGTRIKVKPITHDEYTVNVRNPFKKPSKNVSWRLDFSRDITQGANNPHQRHEIITSADYTVDEYYVRYLKVPIEVSIANGIDCEFNPSVHDEIIDIAVRIATGITDPQSYQLKVNEQKATE
jgi:hypothetical protein